MTDLERYTIVREVCQRYPDLVRQAEAEAGETRARSLLVDAIVEAGMDTARHVPMSVTASWYLRNHLERSAVDRLAEIERPADGG